MARENTDLSNNSIRLLKRLLISMEEKNDEAICGENIM